MTDKLVTNPIPLECYQTRTMTQIPSSVEALMDAAQALSMDQKAALVRGLLGQSADFAVVFGNHQVSGQIVVQINTTDRTVLGDVLDAVADRIRTEGRLAS